MAPGNDVPELSKDCWIADGGASSHMTR
jgi:hypothetical protein